jgi:hypothetical protein
VCGLRDLGSNIRALHSVLLIAATLRHLAARAHGHLNRLFRSTTAARSSLVKVFALFALGEDDALDVQNRWSIVKEELSRELKVRVRGLCTL